MAVRVYVRCICCQVWVRPKAPILFHFFEKAGKMRKLDEKVVSNWQRCHETARRFEALPDRS